MRPPDPSATAYEPLEPDDPRTVGGYRILARLGAGGMGRVYLATTQSGRRLAIKVVRPEFADDHEFRRRFQQEIAAAQRVQSLYTAPVIDADPHGPPMWLATAYVPGPSLARAVAERGPLAPRSVRVLMAGIAEALQAVHRVGVIHRDLKPSNVLLASDGPKVIDFGIARAADATPLTRTGAQIGTPMFMSPEQVLGGPSTPAIDIFALGSVAFYAATGRSPFGDGPQAAVLYRISREEPDLQGCPEELRPLIARCLAKEPERRPALREIIDELMPEGAAPVPEWLPADVPRLVPEYTATPALPPIPPPAGPDAPLHGTVPGRAPGARPRPAAPGVPVPAPSTPRTTGKPNALIGLAAIGAAALLTIGLTAAVRMAVDSSSGSGGEGSRAPTPGGSSSAGDREGTTGPSGAAPGTLIGTYKDISLSDGYRLDFADEPRRPKKATDSDGDFWYDASYVFAKRMTMLDPGQAGGYQACANNTRYFTNASRERFPKGSLLCAYSDSGIIGLIKINGYEDSPAAYMSLDLTLWRGPRDGAAATTDPPEWNPRG